MADSLPMKGLRELDFSLLELNLYLDTHPDNADAVASFNRLLSLREEALRQFPESSADLQAFTPVGDGGYRWISRPWPWEKEAN